MSCAFCISFIYLLISLYLKVVLYTFGWFYRLTRCVCNCFLCLRAFWLLITMFSLYVIEQSFHWEKSSWPIEVIIIRNSNQISSFFIHELKKSGWQLIFWKKQNKKPCWMFKLEVLSSVYEFKEDSKWQNNSVF